jgi:hypothetical protein
MILKVIQGQGVRGLLDYVSRAKKGGVEIQPFLTNLSGSTPREWAAQTASIRALRPGLKKAVTHLILSNGPGSKIDLEGWSKAVQIARAAHGFGADHPFAAFLHEDTDHQHVHLFQLRVGPSGEVVSDSNSFRKNWTAARQIEVELGLAPAISDPPEKRGDRQKLHNAQRAFLGGAKMDRQQIIDRVEKVLSTRPKTRDELAQRLLDEGIEAEFATGLNMGWKLGVKGGVKTKASTLSRSLSWNAVAARLGFLPQGQKSEDDLHSDPVKSPAKPSVEAGNEQGQKYRKELQRQIRLDLMTVLRGAVGLGVEGLKYLIQMILFVIGRLFGLQVDPPVFAAPSVATTDIDSATPEKVVSPPTDVDEAEAESRLEKAREWTSSLVRAWSARDAEQVIRMLSPASNDARFAGAEDWIRAALTRSDPGAASAAATAPEVDVSAAAQPPVDPVVTHAAAQLDAQIAAKQAAIAAAKASIKARADMESELKDKVAALREPRHIPRAEWPDQVRTARAAPEQVSKLRRTLAHWSRQVEGLRIDLDEEDNFFNRLRPGHAERRTAISMSLDDARAVVFRTREEVIFAERMARTQFSPAAAAAEAALAAAEVELIRLNHTPPDPTKPPVTLDQVVKLERELADLEQRRQQLRPTSHSPAEADDNEHQSVQMKWGRP